MVKLYSLKYTKRIGNQELPEELPNSETLGFPVYQDQTGTIWNFKGEAISGPQNGLSLNQLPSYNAFWFAATALFPNSEIFDGNTTVTYQSTTNPFDTLNNPDNFLESSVSSFILLELIPIFLGLLVIYRIIRRKIKGRL